MSSDIKKCITIYADASRSAGGDGTQNKPFTNADEIMAGLLKITENGCYDITVKMAAGDYLLSQTMVFDNDGISKSGSSIHFVCEDEKQARFCAWVPVTGFEETTVHGKKAWAASLPSVRGEKFYPHQCFNAKGDRLSRPRYPISGYLEAELVGYDPYGVAWNEHMDVFRYTDDTISSFTRLDEIQVLMPHYWKDERLQIEKIDTEVKHVKTKTKSACAFIEFYNKGPYCFDNVYEALGTPGQFYVDKGENKLYYIPFENDSIEGFTLFASDLDVIMLIDGMQGSEDSMSLSFENVAFMGSDWKTESRYPIQAATDILGAIRIKNSSYISFNKCTFAHIGDQAIEMYDAVKYIYIQHCTFTDLGTGAISLKGDNSDITSAEIPAEHNHDIIITDNLVHGYGRVNTNAIGIVLRLAHDCVIAHNEVADGYYTGISVGWQWGYDRPETGRKHVTKNVLIEKNYIHDVGQHMHTDMGAIYTLGPQPGTVIRGNLIHTVYSRTDKGWGIYTDEGTTGVIVENNIVYDTKTESFHQHFGKENIVRNNIFAFGGSGVVALSRPEEHIGIFLEGNILLSDGAATYTHYFNVSKLNMVDNNNLVWNTKGNAFCAPGYNDVAKMKSLGLFKNYLEADPCFKDPKNGDFTLPDDSPAFRIGFKPIDMSDVGIRN